MSEQKRKTVYLQGKLFWFKAQGAPRPNYDGDAREWTFEFEPNENSVSLLEDNKVGDRLRDRRDKKGYENREPFLILKRGEFKKDGTRNDKIRIVDAANQTWPESTKIGNESIADVKVQIVDYGPRKKKGIYPLAVRVLELVPYEPQEFEPLAEDDPRVKAAKDKFGTEEQFRKDFDLEEDDEQEQEDIPEESETEEDPLDDDIPE